MTNREITKEELIAELDRWLRGHIDDTGKVDGHDSGGALTDIRKALKGGPDLAIFILGSCFIDAMASFYYGVTKEMLNEESKADADTEKLRTDYPGYKGASNRFVGFIKKYLPTIYLCGKGQDFFSSSRCGLIHSYVERDAKYAFISGRNDCHGKKTIGGQIIINRETFVDDLENVYKKFINDIRCDNELFVRAKRRYDSLKLMKCPVADIVC